MTRVVEGYIKSKKKRGYRKAVEVLSGSRELLDQIGDQAFSALVADLRTRHRAKRSFIAMLDTLPTES